MKTRRQQRQQRHKRRRTTAYKKRRLQRGGLLAPRAALVEYKQDPYSGGVLMSLEDALEYKSDDPIRF
jgi:hypothetical protein